MRREQAAVAVADHPATVVAGLVQPVLDAAGTVEIVPIDLERIVPEAAVEIGLSAGFGRVGGDQQLGPIRIVGLNLVVEQADPGPARAAYRPRHRLARHLMPEHSGEAELHRHVQRVAERHLEEGGRQARVALVARDKRVEGAERHGAGKGGVVEIQRGHREAAVEAVALEMRHADERAATGAEAEAAVHLADESAHGAVAIGPVEQPRVDHPSTGLGLDCEMRQPVQAALGRPVEDLPVDQPPGAGKPDAARADAAQRE